MSISWSAVAQVGIERQVLGTTGTSGGNQSLQVDFTVGEPVISTLSGPGLVLTQGFHQTTAKITGIVSSKGLQWEIRHYPNPVMHTLTVEIGGDVQGSIVLQVVDAQGRMLHHDVVEKYSPQHLHRLQVDSWPAGTYFLSLQAEGGKSVGMGFQKIN
jgi:hypothetical protein